MRVEPVRLGELAARLGRPFEGDPGLVVRGVAPLESAGASDLCFVASPRFVARLAASRAGAVILPEGVDAGGRAAIRSPQPRLDFARAAGWIAPPSRPETGVHPSAWVSPEAHVDPSASVGPGSVVGARSRIGPRTVLHANVTVYDEVEVGADCAVHAGAVLREGTSLGDRVILQPGVVVGGDGFGYEPDEQGRFEKVPQVGRVVIEEDVEIGANTTVDRAALGETRIGRGAKIDNLVMIAHGCEIGAGAVIVAQTGIAGSTKLGRRAILMAQVGSVGHVSIGEGAFVAGRGGVTADVPAGARVFGFPAVSERAWHRTQAALRRLPAALRRLAAVERALGLRGENRERERERW